MATSAFLTIPFVGPAVADYFNTVIVPVCAPPRDRVLMGMSRCLRGTQERAAAALTRLLPPGPKS